MARAAFGALAVLLLLAGLAGAVRVVPWLLDPALPLAVVRVFAESVASYLGEIALWVALPAGLGLALASRSERGELRVFALLGERPLRTALRLAPLCLVWSAALASLSFAAGATARAPGRVLGELLASGRSECATAAEPSSQAVPFLGAAWICEPGVAPRLVGRSPVGGLGYVARDAEINGDLTRISLQDAHFLREGLDLRAGVVQVRGLRPFVTPAALLPSWRAFTVTSCALGSCLTLALLLIRRGAPPAVGLGAGLVGPIGGLLALSAAAQRPGVGVALALVSAAVGPALVLLSRRGLDLRR